MFSKLSISKIYYLAIFLVASLLVVSFVSLKSIINEQKSYAELINKAGKQRMLSQKILANALITGHYPSEDLTKEITLLTDEMYSAADYIESKLKTQGLYNIDRKAIDELITAAHQFEKGPTPELLKTLISRRENFLNSMNEAVKILETQSNNISEAMINYGYVILFIQLALLTTVSVYLFRPIYLKHQKHHAELEQLSDKLKLANENLEHQVLNRTIELEKSKILIEKQSQTKSDFLANMSHELRTPMNAIIGYSNLLRKTELNEKQNDFVSKLLKSSKSLMSLIQDILDFSHIDQGSLEAKSIKFNLNKSITSVIEEYSNKTTEKNIKYFVDIDTDIPDELIGDPDHLNRVIAKITDNAVKFTDSGGSVSIGIEIEDEINNQLILHLIITDTGIGIKTDQAHLLFQSFTQIDPSRTRKHGGIGLGLSITNELVDSMGGKVWFDSVYGEGTTFHIILPFEKI